MLSRTQGTHVDVIGNGKPVSQEYYAEVARVVEEKYSTVLNPFLQLAQRIGIIAPGDDLSRVLSLSHHLVYQTSEPAGVPNPKARATACFWCVISDWSLVAEQDHLGVDTAIHARDAKRSSAFARGYLEAVWDARRATGLPASKGKKKNDDATRERVKAALLPYVGTKTTKIKAAVLVGDEVGKAAGTVQKYIRTMFPGAAWDSKGLDD
jgi:hypothetical protein